MPKNRTMSIKKSNLLKKEHYLNKICHFCQKKGIKDKDFEKKCCQKKAPKQKVKKTVKKKAPCQKKGIKKRHRGCIYIY